MGPAAGDGVGLALGEKKKWPLCVPSQISMATRRSLCPSLMRSVRLLSRPEMRIFDPTPTAIATRIEHLPEPLRPVITVD
jgi:hypothetical protein